ncbi:hypothetical protein HanRHA438_Chr06g0271151 [Helianthus annuus]|nr:hypothetical protein HanRHA438_Chr06g0271151 [Helianthus annuus]
MYEKKKSLKKLMNIPIPYHPPSDLPSPSQNPQILHFYFSPSHLKTPKSSTRSTFSDPDLRSWRRHGGSGTSNRNQATKSPIMAASRRLRDLRSWRRSEIPMKTCSHLLQLDKKGPTIWIVLNV